MWVKLKRTEGHVVPRQQGGSVSAVMAHQAQLMGNFEQCTDATLTLYYGWRSPLHQLLYLLVF
jgi:hypothetical protein